jgi:hypothetical protein
MTGQMPWPCFICASDYADCGHREREILVFLFGGSRGATEAVNSARKPAAVALVPGSIKAPIAGRCATGAANAKLEKTVRRYLRG